MGLQTVLLSAELASSRRVPGAPGLAFETWDNTNAKSHPASRSGPRWKPRVQPKGKSPENLRQFDLGTRSQLTMAVGRNILMWATGGWPGHFNKQRSLCPIHPQFYRG